MTDDRLVLFSGRDGHPETGEGWLPSLWLQHEGEDGHELYVGVGEEVGGTTEGVPYAIYAALIESPLDEEAMERAIEDAASELRLHTLPGATNDRQAVLRAAELLHDVGGYETIANSLRTSAAERFPDADEHEGVLTSDEAARAVIDAALPHLPAGALGRLEKFLRKYPKELAVLSFRPSKTAGVPGEFFFSCHMGEEMPEATLDARTEIVREWWVNHVCGADVKGDIGQDDVKALLDALEELDANVMAGGAVYGADPALAVTITEAVKDARC